MNQTTITEEKDEIKVTPIDFRTFQEKYDDAKSSAYMLICFGGIGLLVLILEILGVYTFPIASSVKILFYVTMSLLFLGFIVGGISSFKTAKNYQELAYEAAHLIKNLDYFLTHDISAEQIDTSIPDFSSLSEDEIYFARSMYLTNCIQSMFSEENPAYYDTMLEYVYQKLYETETDSNI